MQSTTPKTNVLLAEDDHDDVLIFELALEKVPVSVELRSAEDGERLFELLKELIPDILFLDINLPCKDGVACIAEIRRNSEYNNLPVIMYTSFKSKQYIDRCYQSGANFYIVKGNTINELAEKLKRIFSIDWKNFMYYPPLGEFVMGS
jgi:CheY-like chemotaxis protein